MNDKQQKVRYRDGLDKLSRERYDEKLRLISGTDPYQLTKQQLSTDGKQLPKVHYIDLVNYLIHKKSAYSHEDLKAYKSLEAYNQMCYGWVQDVRSMAFDNNILVMARVKHSQRLSEAPLKPFVIARRDGAVEAAHCNCMAGLGESCTHVGAVLFYLEAHWRYMANKTVTQEKAYWPVPAAIDKVPYAEIREIDFTSAATKKRKIDSEINGEQIETRGRMKLPHVPKPTDQEKDDIMKEIHRANPNAVILSVSSQYQTPFIPRILQDGQMPEPLIKLRDEKYVEMDGEELREECKKLFESVTVTPEQMKNVELLTRQQSKSREWHRLRMGRITASNMKAVCSTTVVKPAMSTVKLICGGSSFKNQATAYGCKHEKVALQTYMNMRRTEHENFSVRESGLWLDPNHPYIGATPDGIVSCDCCGEGLVEIKCPYCARNSPLTEVECLKENKLNPNHKYFYQVQTQMLVTGKDYCDFVLWSDNEMIVQRIEPDELIVNEIVTKSKEFFIQVILPEMTGSLITRTSSEVTQNNGRKAAESHPPKPKKLKKTVSTTSVGKESSDILTPIQNIPHGKSDCLENQSQNFLCRCMKLSDKNSVQVVKCDGENCPYIYLHFDCVNLKRKPKPPYYCPDCRKSMWK